MIKKNWYYTLLIIVICLQVNGLVAGNSIFSITGLPYQYSGNDIYSQGMGDVGIGDGLRLAHGFGNPALISTANTVNFYTGVKLGYIKYNTDVNSSYTDDAVDFPFFSIVVPYNKHKFAFQFNSWKSGNFENEVEVNYIIDGEESTLIEQNLFSSYIYKLDAYYGYRLLGGWSVALGPNIFIGHREQELIQDSGSGVFNTKNKSKVSFTDIGFSTGLLKQGATWSLGANYEYGRKIDAEKEFFTIHSNQEMQDVEFNLPHKIAFGVAKKWAGIFKLAGDFNYEIWDNFMGEDYHNSWKAGIGFAYEPKLGRKEFYELIPIRTGFSLRELPFDYNNEKIYEKSATIGFSLPLKSRIDKLDFAFEYMIRGDVDTHGIEDRSSMFMIGVSGFDIFRKVYTRKEPREIPIKEDLN